jgi:(p)ppGpp synthase/HD superfamily hydrolase
MAVTPEPTIAQTNGQLYRQLTDMHWSEKDLTRARNGYELGVHLFSGKYRQSHRPFINHLVGTASVVAEVHGRQPMVLAALLHAAYAVGDWGPRSRLSAMREEVRNAVGTQAEELIWEYSDFLPNPNSVHTWTEATRGMPSHLAQDLVVLRLANQVEELQDLAPTGGSGKNPINDPDRLDVLFDAATTLGAEPAAERLRMIAACTNPLRVPRPLESPRYPGNTVPGRSYRLTTNLRIRAAVRRSFLGPLLRASRRMLRRS